MRQHLNKCKIHRQTNKQTNSHILSFVRLCVTLYACVGLCMTMGVLWVSEGSSSFLRSSSFWGNLHSKIVFNLEVFFIFSVGIFFLFFNLSSFMQCFSCLSNDKKYWVWCISAKFKNLSGAQLIQVKKSECGIAHPGQKY